ncbi:MAG: outer rane autotransporter barrel domain protein, partial [Ramlibacter sp.]|nr:outer rane autotransporter barrel domain protein [Ramlibacter sp.]
MFAEYCARWHRRLKVLLLAFGLAVSVNAHAADTYDTTTGVLTIPLLVIGNTAFFNVRITIGGLVGVTGGTAVNAYDTFSGGQLSIPSLQLGANVFTNVVIRVGTILGIGGATPAFVSAPVLVPVNPLADATVGQAYTKSLVGGVWPSSTYTYSIDTLANGSLPTGMTIHQDGTLSGTPFATGRADVNGHQIPNTFTFGVCATDTLSRVTLTPCPQTSITVNPAASTLTVSKAGTGSGTVTSSPAGIACGATCSASFASS